MFKRYDSTGSGEPHTSNESRKNIWPSEFAPFLLNTDIVKTKISTPLSCLININSFTSNDF